MKVHGLNILSTVGDRIQLQLVFVLSRKNSMAHIYSQIQIRMLGSYEIILVYIYLKDLLLAFAVNHPLE